MIFQCNHCSRNFSTPYALKRHISSKHPILNQPEESVTIPISTSPTFYEEPGLWEDDLTIDSNYYSPPDSSNILEHEKERVIISEYEEMVS